MGTRLRHWALLNPLARLALAAIIGVVLAEFGVGKGHETTLCCLSLGAGFLVLLLPRWIPLEIPTALVFAFIHHVRLDETRDHPLRTQVSGKDRIEATVVGYLIPAVEGGTGGDTSHQQVTVNASSIEIPREGRILRGSASLRGWMTAAQPLPAPGTYEMQGRLRLAQPPTNPGQFDTGAFSLRQGFVADFAVRTVRLIKEDPVPIRTHFLKAAEHSRDWIKAQLEKGIEGEDQPIALISGMALGVTDVTSAEIQRPFRNTGTIHIFSVSGLHVALISTIGWMFLGVFGIKRAAAMVILIPAVFAYAFITGWHPSAARAAIMVSVFMAAILFDRNSRLQNSLGAAALILLALDTQQLFTAGFQLSFGVLFAIALLNAPLVNLTLRWTQLDPFLPPQLATWSQRGWSRFKTSLASSVCVSSAATVGSLPLMLWHFGLATPIAILANCALIPLAFVVLAAAFVSVLFAIAHLSFAQILSNNANWLFAKLMLNGAVLFSNVPGSYFTWDPRTMFQDRPPVELSVMHLPYGEAAQYLRDGDAHWLLDTGSKKTFGRIVQPLLQKQGADTLNGIILSHGDIDHIGGAARAFAEHHCQLACVSTLEPWKHESGASSLKRFLAGIHASSSPLKQLSAGDTLDFGPHAKALVLYPSPTDLHDKGDDRALVLRLDLDGFRVLWCNDIGFITEKTLLDRHLRKTLRCDVLVRNQHASDYSALPEFLLAVRPKIIISSNVPSVAEHAMPASLVDYARARGSVVFDQNVHGAVTITVKNDRLTASGFVSGQSHSLKRRK